MQTLTDYQLTKDWAETFLKANNYTSLSHIEIVRDRPWARVSRILTAKGNVYLKQMVMAFAAER